MASAGGSDGSGGSVSSSSSEGSTLQQAQSPPFPSSWFPRAQSTLKSRLTNLGSPAVEVVPMSKIDRRDTKLFPRGMSDFGIDIDSDIDGNGATDDMTSKGADIDKKMRGSEVKMLMELRPNGYCKHFSSRFLLSAPLVVFI